MARGGDVDQITQEVGRQQPLVDGQHNLLNATAARMDQAVAVSPDVQELQSQKGRDHLRSTHCSLDQLGRCPLHPQATTVKGWILANRQVELTEGVEYANQEFRNSSDIEQVVDEALEPTNGQQQVHRKRG